MRNILISWRIDVTDSSFIHMSMSQSPRLSFGYNRGSKDAIFVARVVQTGEDLLLVKTVVDSNEYSILYMTP